MTDRALRVMRDAPVLGLLVGLQGFRQFFRLLEIFARFELFDETVEKGERVGRAVYSEICLSEIKVYRISPAVFRVVLQDRFEPVDGRGGELLRLQVEVGHAVICVAQTIIGFPEALTAVGQYL